MAHVYPTPSSVWYNIAAETIIRNEPHNGLAMLNKALWAGVNPKPTRMRGNCWDVLFGNSLKNI